MNPTREKLLDVTFEEIYTKGYNATSVGAILKRANTPKGSMYHFFDSKKSMVIAMILERLYPKMDLFFVFEKDVKLTVFQSVRRTFVLIARNKLLVKHGCPLYRLMVELSDDKAFSALLTKKYLDMKTSITALLETGKELGEFKEELDTVEFANFILSSTWGVLSLPPEVSSSKSFLLNTGHVLELLESYALK